MVGEAALRGRLCVAKLKKAYQSLGSRLVFNLTGDLPYVPGVGHCVLLPNNKGGQRAVILPKTHYDKNKTRFPNRVWPNRKDYLRHALGLCPPKESSLRKGLPPVTQDCLTGPSYVREGGLRKVEPYFDTMKNQIKSSAPGPGMGIVDYLATRFTVTPRRMFEILCRTGQLAVNLERVEGSYILQTDDVITHTMHKHEPPILDLPLEVVHDCDQILVVNKPSSWPVYPIANYRFNSMTYILHKELGYKDLRVLHRIDAPTSGIMIMAKGREAATELHRKFTCLPTRKEYVALVDGSFPAGEVVCEEPLGDYRLTRDLWKPQAVRAARTEFRLLHYCRETDTSLLSCIPVTGRTHQIRLHLVSLGHSIVQDALYNERDREALPRTLTHHENPQVLGALDKMEEQLDEDEIRSKVKTGAGAGAGSGAGASLESVGRQLSHYKYCLHCQSKHYRQYRYP